VYSKLHCFIHFLIAATIGVASFAAAQAQAPAAPAATPAPAAVTPAAASSIHGHIADPTGALIPGATVTITNALGVAVKSTTSDAAGSYSVTGLAPGGYIVQATVEGFANFTSPTLQLAAGQTKRVDVSMAIEATEQSVTVTDEEGAPEVSTDAGSNASAIVLKGKDLDALSDDPDELSNELTALAGPSAGLRNRRFARSASTRIRFLLNSTASAMAASRFLPSQEQTCFMGAASCRATTVPSTLRIRLLPPRPTIAFSTTEPSADRSTKRHRSFSALKVETTLTPASTRSIFQPSTQPQGSTPFPQIQTATSFRLRARFTHHQAGSRFRLALICNWASPTR
jgi:hypothetical protein